MTFVKSILKVVDKSNHGEAAKANSEGITKEDEIAAAAIIKKYEGEDVENEEDRRTK